MFKQIAISMEIIGETFSQNSCLKPLYERSSCRLILLALSFKFKAKPENLKAGVFLNSKSDQKIFLKTCYKKIDASKSVTLDLSFISL